MSSAQRARVVCQIIDDWTRSPGAVAEHHLRGLSGRERRAMAAEVTRAASTLGAENAPFVQALTAAILRTPTAA